MYCQCEDPWYDDLNLQGTEISPCRICRLEVDKKSLDFPDIAIRREPSFRHFSEGLTATGHRPSEPEPQDFPNRGQTEARVDTDWKDTDFSAMESYLLTWAAEQSKMSYEELISYNGWIDNPDNWGTADEWPPGSIGRIGDVFVYGYDLDTEVKAAGLRVLVIDDTITGRGMVGPLDPGGYRIKYAVKEKLPNDDGPNWEKLRDRKHGRRKQRGKKRR